MTCRRMDRVLASHSPGRPLSTEALGHVAECAICRRLVDLLERDRAASGPESCRLARIKRMIVLDMAPVTALPPSWVLQTAAGAVFLTVLAVESALLGTGGWRLLGVSQKVAVFAPLFLCAGGLVACIVQPMTPGSRIVISPARLCAATLSLLAIVFALVFQSQPEAAFIPAGIGCLKVGLASACFAGASFWLFLRRGAVLYPELSGASAGGLAGIAGLTVLEFRCPNLNVYHILIWHFGVLVIAMLSGLAIGIAARTVTFWCAARR